MSLRSTWLRSATALALGVLVCAVATASAVAAPEWYVKKKGVFAKLTTAVKIETEGHFELNDTEFAAFKTPLAISCQEVGESGELKTAGAGKIGTFEAKLCEPAKVEHNFCERTGVSEGANEPWSTELYKEGTTVRQKIVSKEPAWRFSCETIGGFPEVTCGVALSTHIVNNTTGGYVEAEFDSKSGKTPCSVTRGEEDPGEWKGVVKIKPTGAEKTAGVEAIKAE